MDVMTAAFNVAEDYEGGARQLALDIGENPNTFSHALNGTAGAALRARTLVKMSKRTKDFRILFSFAAECGYMCVPLPESLDVGGNDCFRRLSEASQEFAKLCQEACADLGDDELNDNEMARLNTHVGKLIQAAHAFQRAATAKHQASKPAPRY